MIKERKVKISLGERLYFVSLCRLKASFKSITLLNNNGLYVDILPIIRLVYEQLCWVLYVIDEDDDIKIEKNKITMNVRCMEKINENIKSYIVFCQMNLIFHHNR